MSRLIASQQFCTLTIMWMSRVLKTTRLLSAMIVRIVHKRWASISQSRLTLIFWWTWQWKKNIKSPHQNSFPNKCPRLPQNLKLKKIRLDNRCPQKAEFLQPKISSRLSEEPSLSERNFTHLGYKTSYAPQTSSATTMDFSLPAKMASASALHGRHQQPR